MKRKKSGTKKAHSASRRHSDSMAKWARGVNESMNLLFKAEAGDKRALAALKKRLQASS
jgi:hypothetical protein